MKISAYNAHTFFARMNDAKAALLTTGGAGQVYIKRLQAIRETFQPDDIQPGFFEAIEAVVTDLAGMHETTMAPMQKFSPIDPSAYTRPLQGAERAIGYIREAVAWLRDHAE